jgi:hypothetical protein
MKNLFMVVLLVFTAGSLLFGINKMKESEQLQEELDKMKTNAKVCETKALELEKLYQESMVQAQIQRTICEEQLKALKK